MRVLLLNICLFLYFPVFTQTAEKLQVHFDKPFYVSGEDAWYKIYFENEPATIQSKVVRVEWLSPDGAVILQQKLKVENNFAVGDLAIPYDWSEGNYLFRAYTLWGLNFGDQQYFQQIIPVYNLLETPKAAEQSIEKQPIKQTDNSSKGNLQIDITTNTANYKKRDFVDLNIELKDANGNPIAGHISIAVLDGNYMGEIEGTEIKSEETSTSSTFNQKFEAEKGLVLNGQLVDKTGKPLDTRFLSIFFPNTKSFERTSISKGKLTIPIPEFKGEQPIQFFDMNPFHEPIPQLKLTEIAWNPSYRGQLLQRSKSVANYLFLLSKFRQYREVFKLKNADYGPKFSFLKNNWEPDKDWTMEKYTGLSDLASFAAEIIAAGRVVGKGKDRSIRLQYGEKSIYNKLSPWYLVNGWLTEDEVTALKIPFREIEKVELFNTKKSIASQLDPSMVSRGMLTINTKDGKTPNELIKKPNNLTISGYYPTRQFPNIGIIDNNVPDLRPVIYWNPTIATTVNGTAKICFKTSDSIGTHWISVVGQGANGEIVTTKLGYEVTVE